MANDVPEDRLRMIRIEKLCELFPISRATVYRMIKRGEFPRPVMIGGTNMWVAKDIVAWLEAKMEPVAPAPERFERDADDLI